MGAEIEGFILVEGYDDAILGVDVDNERLIYSKTQMMKIYIEATAMDDDEENHDLIGEAYDYLNHNIWQAYYGEHTPIYCEDMAPLSMFIDGYDEQK